MRSDDRSVHFAAVIAFYKIAVPTALLVGADKKDKRSVVSAVCDTSNFFSAPLHFRAHKSFVVDNLLLSAQCRRLSKFFRFFPTQRSCWNMSEQKNAFLQMPKNPFNHLFTFNGKVMCEAVTATSIAGNSFNIDGTLWQ